MEQHQVPTSPRKQSYSTFEHDSKLRHSVIDVEGTPTCVSYVLGSREDHVVIFIPGTPGIIEFYDQFMTSLHKCYPELSLFGISYAGHSTVRSDKALIQRAILQNRSIRLKNKKVYSLDEQIQHKLAFIRQYIKGNKKVYLVGHSLGCYMITRMLAEMEDLSMIERVILMFPVFERTMETEAGQKWVPLLSKGERVILTCSRVLNALPRFVKHHLIKKEAERRTMDSELRKSTRRGIATLTRRNTLQNLAQTARDLSRIGENSNVERLVNFFGDRLTFYYGATDYWTPLSFFVNTKSKYPSADVRLDNEGLAHSFIFESSQRVAEIVAATIKPQV